MLLCRLLAAADEVHDLEVIVCLHRCVFPLRVGKNLKIALDRHAATRHPDMIEQRSYIEAIRNFAALAVDRDSHVYEPGGEVTGATFARERIANRSSSRPACPLA